MELTCAMYIGGTTRGTLITNEIAPLESLRTSTLRTCKISMVKLSNQALKLGEIRWKDYNNDLFPWHWHIFKQFIHSKGYIFVDFDTVKFTYLWWIANFPVKQKWEKKPGTIKIHQNTNSEPNSSPRKHKFWTRYKRKKKSKQSMNKNQNRIA